MNWFHWALLSALFAGVTAIFAKVGVSGVNSNLATAVRTTIVLAFTWLIAATTADMNDLKMFSKRTWTFLILSGVATGLSWLCYFRALQLGEASRVAPIDKLSVIFVMLFAFFFLGEKLTWQHGIGGVLVFAGAVILAWK